MPSSGSLTTDSDTVGEWLALLPSSRRGGAHQSGREARQADRCETGDDTKYGVVWPETAARLSQPGWLHHTSHFLGGVTGRRTQASTVYPHFSERGSRLPTIMDPLVHAAPLSTPPRGPALCPARSSDLRLEVCALAGLCVLH